MREVRAKFWTLLLALGLVSLGPACVCGPSEAQAADLPSASSPAGVAADSADDGCCSSDDEGDKDHSEGCCGCDGVAADNPQVLSGLVTVPSADPSTSLEAPESQLRDVPAPWTLDTLHRHDTRTPPLSSRDDPSLSSGTTPKHLALQVLRL